MNDINNFFGTDGIRTKVGKRPLNKNDLHQLAHAIAQWLIEKFGKKAVVVIAQDTRESSSWIKTTLLSTLLEYPFVIYDMHIAPTGADGWAVNSLPEVQCGLIITASHNLYQDNGIKILLKNEKITPQDQQILSAFFFKQKQPFSYSSYGIYHGKNNLTEKYTTNLLTKFEPNFLAGKKIVLDCANGAMSHIAPQLFKQLGAQIIPIAHRPNGKNINASCGSTNPQEAQKKVIEHNATMGFCFDGDGDRVIAINNMGHIKDGDSILALLLTNPLYKDQSEIISTIMSNQALEDYCATKGIQFTRTQVGDSYILEKLIKQKLLVGGEPCGHIILNDHLPVSDGLYVAMQVAYTCSLFNNFIMDQIAQYPQVNLNITYKKKVSLELPHIKKIISKARRSGARVIVRYSGTEPVLRIMVEARNKKLAAKILHEISAEFKIVVEQKEYYDKKNKTAVVQNF